MSALWMYHLRVSGFRDMQPLKSKGTMDGGSLSKSPLVTGVLRTSRQPMSVRISSGRAQKDAELQ
ncbi:MAG: hypothetical protein Q4Q62_04840 [Thermoplasmata archaeon]|nr:hypothetical protein [Thermoplasmata archaeon]